MRENFSTKQFMRSVAVYALNYYILVDEIDDNGIQIESYGIK